MKVAEAAIAALGQKHAFADSRQIGQNGFLIFVENFGANGHTQHHVIAILAGTLTAHARHAVLGEEMLLIAEVDQRVQPVHRFGPDIAAFAAVAAIRATVFDILLAPEADTATAPRSRSDRHTREVEEFHVPSFRLSRVRAYVIKGAGSTLALEVPVSRPVTLNPIFRRTAPEAGLSSK